jgi:dUTP pyrophosphatase
MNRLSVMRVNPSAILPERKTFGSVGFDIAACLDDDVIIAPGETRKIGSGFAIALEPGFAAFIYARSGLGINSGIIPANCVGVIDSDYRGEVIVGLRNTSNEMFTVKNGDRIAQMVITKCEMPEIVLCEDLDETGRGAGGFGSTGG